MTTTNPTATWCTIAEAAAILHVHTDTVRLMIQRGEIHAERVGPRLIRIDTGTLPRSTPPVDPISEAAAAVAAAAPPLTAEQRDKIAAILRGGATS